MRSKHGWALPFLLLMLSLAVAAVALVFEHGLLLGTSLAMAAVASGLIERWNLKRGPP